MTKTLGEVLGEIDWASNVDDFLKDQAAVDRIQAANTRLAVWSRQFEEADKGNPALCFIREMQSLGHSVAGLLAIGMYKPSIALSRSILETGLYFVYFRDHAKELATLVRSKDYYVSKEDVLIYLREHIPNFKPAEQLFGFNGRLQVWYGEVSAIAHGQIPGVFSAQHGLAKLKTAPKELHEAVHLFETGVELAHTLFLVTVARELWPAFSNTAKKALLSGLPGTHRQKLGLDGA